MTHDAGEFDPVLEELGRLRDYDVSSQRANRLRDRCHANLGAHTARREESFWTRVAYPALLGTWGAAYFFATLWRFAQAMTR